MPEAENQLATTYKFQVPVELLESESCKIKISGFLLEDFRRFNPDEYSIICRLGETCDGFTYFPHTSKIIFEGNNKSYLFHEVDKLLPNIADDLGITDQAAKEKFSEFFFRNQLLVEPKGIQGIVYNSMKRFQNISPMLYTTEAVALLKTHSLTGFQIICRAPLTFVGATYIGAVFFSYAGSVAGNNSVGVIFDTTSYILSRPMRGVEITLNGLILEPISRFLGVPVILNGTQEILKGKGISIAEYVKIGTAFERISNSRAIEKCKDIYKIIRRKD